MAGPSRTYCVSEYCTGVPHNEHPWRFHSLRPISLPFTKSAEEPIIWTGGVKGSEQVREELNEHRAGLDPVELLRSI